MGAGNAGLRLSDEIAQSLERWILAQGLPVGARMPTEKLLCEQFGVSRPVIREAMARLKAEGCIRSRQGSGAYIAALPGQTGFRFIRHSQAPASLVTREVAEVLELRLIMEAGVAELATSRRTTQDIQRIQAALDAMDLALAEGRDAAASDDEFHVAIAAATRNPQLEQFQIFMGRQLSDSRRPTWNDAGHRLGLARQAQREHRAIFDAIVAADGAAAKEAAQEHIAGAMARFGIARGCYEATIPDYKGIEEKN